MTFCFITVYLETSCQLPPGNTGIHPIGFRTHAHSLGAVISGYRVSESKDKWSLIGKQTPKLPQTFYPVADPTLTIRGGEYLAARCTMVRLELGSALWAIVSLEEGITGS